VGQYFCQIQRASLILQDDMPTSPELMDLAQKVKEKAQPLGFWPSAPRIPITVELKDYAQWLSTRRDQAPVGILTYLAERIHQAVEVPVSVVSLRRALGARSWFVAFDGLDEVPHDKREAVAQEVRLFLSSVVAHTRADLLALCTSRPQGYTGQFSDLDGPTIELTPLSPQQALQCAQPVIELGRPAAEAAAALSTLSTAAQSESVRELMTTPLQAHIMAVVVRDGQRPPERRWKLFTNFYEVIRRREANRNLPEARLAKLLREEEGLLKTMHNRLGWLLHARAERSEGAQTDLHRDEFRRLVEQAVSQMIESEVESTVEVLMKATTDRLVLVSTPDDGDHVRFQIRPLQEFFAAEFLYDSVSAEQLRERLQVLGATRTGVRSSTSCFRPWPRTTARPSSRSPWTCWKNGIEARRSRETTRSLQLLYRRLGRGAVVAARLLQEGVLEQDKRVRDRFRNVLKPLAAMTDSEVLWPLIEIEQPNSRRWLLQFLLQSLHESSYAESVGAASVLVQQLRDSDDPKMLSEVRDFLLAAPADYLTSVIFSLWPHHIEDKTVYCDEDQEWLLQLMAELLMRSQWRKLSHAAISMMLDTLLFQVDEDWVWGADLGLCKDEEELLLAFAPASDEEDWDQDGERSKPASRTTDYGIVKVWHFEHDWTTGTFEAGDWTESSLRDAAGARGIFQFARRVLLFGASKRLSDLHAALSMLETEHADLLQVLPPHIQAYIPLDVESLTRQASSVASLLALDEEALTALLHQQQDGEYRCSRPSQAFTNADGTGTIEQWEALVEDYPLLAVSVWAGLWQTDRYASSVLSSPEAVAVMLDTIFQRPEILPRLPLAWGFYLALPRSERPSFAYAFEERLRLPSPAEARRRRSRRPSSLTCPMRRRCCPTGSRRRQARSETARATSTRSRARSKRTPSASNATSRPSRRQMRFEKSPRICSSHSKLGHTPR
jgi:hypothetical protein